MISEILISLFLLIGAAFALIGAIGLATLPDFFTRLHGPTKATTLGVGGMLFASSIHFTHQGNVSLHEILIILFLFLTAPVSAHLMMKAALHLRLPQSGSDKSLPKNGTLSDGDKIKPL
jgi:multicomponent K+:H+ antiporter subunit G